MQGRRPADDQQHRRAERMRLRARPTAGCIATHCERLGHERSLEIPSTPRACIAAATCLPRHLPCEPLPTSMHTASPARLHTGQHSGRPLPRTPMSGKATKSNTTRQYERPGTAGSSSRRHRRIGIRGPAPAEPRVNRTKALRSAPATRLTTGHVHRADTRFCPLPPARSCALP